MTGTRRAMSFRVWLLIGAGLAIVVGANSHLVYVAVTSQPDCVAHARGGQGDAARGLYSAAKSACTVP